MRLVAARSTATDQIYFHTPGKRAFAYPYQMLGAGKAIRNTKEGRTNRRFHQHLLILTTGGFGHVEFQDREFVAQKGTVTWVDTSLKYSHGCHLDASEWQYVWMGFRGYRLNLLMNVIRAHQNPIFPIADLSLAESLFEHVTGTLKDRAIVADSELSAVVSRIIAILVANRDNLQSIDTDDDWLGELVQTVLDDITHPWHIDELSRTCSRSESQLYRKFKQRFGTSPMDWLRHERINLAKGYLIQSKEQIALVAHKCGYPDPYHFSRDFKRIVGLPPSLFRQAWDQRLFPQS